MTTTKAATKRAERERRRANGEVRCELWLVERDMARLQRIMDHYDTTQAQAIKHALVKANLYIQDAPQEPF